MTTAELLALIQTDWDSHMACPDDERARTHVCTVTIGSLTARSGLHRRVIEAAIETARLEGKPIITRGGVRVAETAREAHALADWLEARVASQNRTVGAVRARAVQMADREAMGVLRASREATGEQMAWLR